MNIVGNKLVISLVDAELTSCDSYEVCPGITIFNMSDQYVSSIRRNPELSARYGRSLQYMRSGLVIEPDAVGENCPTTWNAILEFGVFASLALRLATGVPVDIPYWFDLDDDEIKGFGNTQIKTYRTGNRHMYPLDDGDQAQGLSAFQDGFQSVVQKYLSDANKNVLIRSIRFSAISFETRHVLTRLVNNAIALETLFCNTGTEIAFQVASRISWYLEFGGSDERRIELFRNIKELYSWRSKIVHGADVSEKSEKLKQMLIFSETINTRVFQRILRQNHVDVFSRNNSARDVDLRALSLGVNCDLLQRGA